ncbi:MAG: GntR family transcriptional regulator [Phycisphaeraceae bacterium]
MGTIGGTGFKSEQTRRRITEWVHSGRFKPGKRLPSERALAAELEVNTQTVRRALAQLEAEGLIEKSPRVGNFLRQMPAQRTRQVGLILPTETMEVPSHAMPSVLMRGMSEVLSPQRYANTMLFYDGSDPWSDAGELAVERGLEGVVLLTRHHVRQTCVQRMLDAGVAVVAMGYCDGILGLDVPWVALDPTPTLWQLLRRLVALGHRDIAVAAYSTTVNRTFVHDAAQRFFEGREARAVRGRVVTLPNDPDLDLAPLQHLIDGDDRPTALIVPDEVTAACVYRRAYARGLRVPADLSLAALADHTPFAHSVPLTAADGQELELRYVGAAAAILDKRLHGQPLEARGLVIDGQVQWKESIGPVGAVPAALREG